MSQESVSVQSNAVVITDGGQIASNQSTTSKQVEGGVWGTLNSSLCLLCMVAIVVNLIFMPRPTRLIKYIVIGGSLLHFSICVSSILQTVNVDIIQERKQKELYTQIVLTIGVLAITVGLYMNIYRYFSTRKISELSETTTGVSSAETTVPETTVPETTVPEISSVSGTTGPSTTGVSSSSQ